MSAADYDIPASPPAISRAPSTLVAHRVRRDPVDAAPPFAASRVRASEARSGRIPGGQAAAGRNIRRIKSDAAVVGSSSAPV
jgi:hypothetical protein